MTDTAEGLQLEVVGQLPALKRFAQRFHHDRSDVDDLVQETVMKALKSINTFRPGTNMKSWLFTIMRHAHATNYVKQKRIVLGITDFDDMMPVALPSQEWHLRKKDFDRVYIAMPRHFREVCDEIMIGGQTYEDAAIQHQCAVGTIKSRVNRAKKYLADQLGDSVSRAASIS
jgi:RNA polymerase sigma-70 factor (ECF subfamily)